MFAKPDYEKGIITLTAETEEERRIIQELSAQFAASEPRATRIKYDGRDGADPDDPLSNHMILFFQHGEERIRLVSSDKDSELCFRQMRDAFFFGHPFLIIIGIPQVATPSIEACISFCKLCGAPLIEMGRVEWNICEACVAKCAHEYKWGATHGGDAGVLGFNEFCGKCGRGKPAEKPAPEESAPVS